MIAKCQVKAVLEMTVQEPEVDQGTKMIQGPRVVTKTAQIQEIRMQIQEVNAGMLVTTLRLSKRQNELKQSICAIEDKFSILAL